MAISAMNLRVSPEVISGPLSDHATRIGPAPSSRSSGLPSGPSSIPVDGSTSVWSSKARANSSCTWVEVISLVSR